MKKKYQSKAAVTRRSFSAGLGAAGIVAGTAPFNIVRAQGAALKVGVLLPRSGVQAGIERAALHLRTGRAVIRHRRVAILALNDVPA